MNEQDHTNAFPALLARPPFGELIGREDDMQAGLCLLARPEVRLLVVTGMGGVGKTRLVYALAELATRDFVDGVLAVSLAALRQPAQLLPALLQAAGPG